MFIILEVMVLGSLLGLSPKILGLAYMCLEFEVLELGVGVLGSSVWGLGSGFGFQV
jgi:hypothetical protein